MARVSNINQLALLGGVECLFRMAISKLTGRRGNYGHRMGFLCWTECCNSHKSFTMAKPPWIVWLLVIIVCSQLMICLLAHFEYWLKSYLGQCQGVFERLQGQAICQ